MRLRRKKLKYQEAYWAERRGRARVEKEMKNIANIRLSKDEGFFVQPIGHISSCYRQCVGTPRQGMLAPHSRSSITLAKNISPEAMDGLEDFSHVWITFQFHLNSNTLKEANAFSSRRTFQAKINPPMLKGIKLGVLATRSPHRPNPIGVTLAQIRSIDKKNRTLHLYACDLVDGTPVLDVKVSPSNTIHIYSKLILVSFCQPYVPSYDTVPEYRIPNWIKETVFTRNDVVVNPECVDAVKSIQKKLYQYKDDADEYILGRYQHMRIV
jgi:tRNA-Thr(GGU) m(6)t(6)A37 methyltransferase TsaA